MTTATATLVIDDGEYHQDGKEVRCIRCTAPIGDTGESLGWLVAAAQRHAQRHAEEPRDLLGELAGEPRQVPFPNLPVHRGPAIRTVLDHEPEGAAVL